MDEFYNDGFYSRKRFKTFQDFQTGTTVFSCRQDVALLESVHKAKPSFDASHLIDRLGKFSLHSNDTSPVKDAPMEIDTSYESMNDATHKTDAETVLHHSKERFSYLSTLCLAITILLVFLAVYVAYSGGSRYTFVNVSAQLDNIKRDLKAVLSQTTAVDTVISSVEFTTGFKVLLFVGSSGVGKTFTANILKRNFALVHEISGQNLSDNKKQRRIFDNLGVASCNLVIVEDLTATDCASVIDFIGKIPEEFCVLVIPIFNIQSTLDGWTYHIQKDDYDLIHNTFDTSRFRYDLAFFNVIKVDVLKEWLQRELRRRNIEEHRHPELIQHLIDVEQVERKGFKGVDTKILLALDNVH